MKKTLYLAMTFSCVYSSTVLAEPITAETFTDNLKQVLVDSGYEYGQTADYTLKFTVNSVTQNTHTSALFMILTDERNVVYQSSGTAGVAYVGLSPHTNAVDAWITPSSQENGISTWELDDLANEPWPNTWLTYNTNGDRTAITMAGTVVTYSSTLYKTTLTLEFVNGTTSVVEYENGTMFDLADFYLHNSTSNCTYIKTLTNASVSINGTTYSLPEPTTATLSLLALASLAARRRRR